MIQTASINFKYGKSNTPVVEDKTDVDMYYRFTSDSEPTDEQLKVLMLEVRDDVCKQNEELQHIIMENLRKEYEKARVMYPYLKQWKNQNFS
jgi:hypothetical protein